MKERPILFSDAMVRAILDGRKTQTRRVMKPQPDDDGKVTVGEIGSSRGVAYVGNAHSGGIVTRVPCPYGQPGDRLWVREAWARFVIDGDDTDPIVYRADGAPGGTIPTMVRWRPSIHLKRQHSRILLEIAGVRVERARDISTADAFAEGVTQRGNLYCMDWSGVGKPSGVKELDGSPSIATEQYVANDNPVGAFASYWEKINGDDSWNANPWVWVIEFKRA